jgi:hypothetical protein
LRTATSALRNALGCEHLYYLQCCRDYGKVLGCVVLSSSVQDVDEPVLAETERALRTADSVAVAFYEPHEQLAKLRRTVARSLGDGEAQTLCGDASEDTVVKVLLDRVVYLRLWAQVCRHMNNIQEIEVLQGIVELVTTYDQHPCVVPVLADVLEELANAIATHATSEAQLSESESVLASSVLLRQVAVGNSLLEVGEKLARKGKWKTARLRIKEAVDTLACSVGTNHPACQRAMRLYHSLPSRRPSDK